MSLKILIVEDEAMIAEDLAVILMKSGYEVVGTAYSGERAMDLLHSRRIDLVLLDIYLGPSISGLDVAKLLNEKYKIPFIFLTSFADDTTLNSAGNYFPEAYLTKPFKKKDIIAAIRMCEFKLINSKKSPYKALVVINAELHQALTVKEYELLLDLARGATNDELCKLHHISLNTVKTHLKAMFSKLDVSSRSNAILRVLVS